MPEMKVVLLVVELLFANGKDHRNIEVQPLGSTQKQCEAKIPARKDKVWESKAQYESDFKSELILYNVVCVS